MTTPSRDGESRSTRRQFVAGAGALTSLPFLLAACGGSDDPESAGETNAGPWTFTDDRHVEVSLDARPKRLLVHQDSLAALWPFGIRALGTYGNQAPGDNEQFTAQEIANVESVGEVFGEVNLEAMAALRPDLIITSVWPGQGNVAGGFTDEKHEEKAARIAPIVTINSQVPYTDMMGRYRDLAGALGADLEAPEVVAMDERLVAAFGALRAAAEAKPDVTVLAISQSADVVYIATPNQYGDLMEYQAAGVSLVTPTGDTSDFGGLWEDVSWENVDKYAADIVLIDGRPLALTPEDLAKKPTWGGLPSVESDQVGQWYVGTTYRPSFFIEQVEAVTGLIEQSKDVVSA